MLVFRILIEIVVTPYCSILIRAHSTIELSQIQLLVTSTSTVHLLGALQIPHELKSNIIIQRKRNKDPKNKKESHIKHLKYKSRIYFFKAFEPFRFLDCCIAPAFSKAFFSNNLRIGATVQKYDMEPLCFTFCSL